MQTLFAGPGLNPMASDPLCSGKGVTMVDSPPSAWIGRRDGYCALLQYQPAHRPLGPKDKMRDGGGVMTAPYSFRYGGQLDGWAKFGWISGTVDKGSIPEPTFRD